jgi:hypothetical protein
MAEHRPVVRDECPGKESRPEEKEDPNMARFLAPATIKVFAMIKERRNSLGGVDSGGRSCLLITQYSS